MSVLRGRPPGFAAGINGAKRSHSASLRSLGRRSPSLAIRAPVSLRPHPESSLKTADDPVNHPFLNGILPFETGSKGQRLEPYYLAAYAAYKLDVNFRTGRINPKLKSARFQILLAMRHLANSEQLPQLNAKQMEKYCSKIIEVLWDGNKADELCGEAATLVEKAAEGNLDRDNVRTQTFTERVIALSKKSAGQSV